ncbi:MAG: IS3 family transposase [Solobacterium sp.]|nr:IS3 family transposase [Solobacterium sp.]
MKRHGHPTNGKNTVVGDTQNFRANAEDNAYLISTGKFIAGKKGKGISFSKEFIEELYENYPSQSIEEGLRNAGINPEIVGYQRIHSLKRRFDGGYPQSSEKKSYSEENISRLKEHPYVKRITAHQLVLSPAFYSDAHYLVGHMHVNDILCLFEIEPELLSVSMRNNIRYRLSHWDEEEAGVYAATEQNLRILRKVMKALEDVVDHSFQELHDLVPTLPKPDRKRLCQYIDAFDEDPGRKYTKRHILSLIGISKSSFYACLKNVSYGMHDEARDLQDEEDIKVIQEVIDYKGYPKGTRMIYMMMKKITGKQFSINKIRRLKRKYGIACPVRKANVNRRAAQKLLEKNRKGNHLKRTFRLHRPHEVYLSDITYLDFGNNKRAYGSAVRDSVTGKMICFEISEHNDLELADHSLDWFRAETTHENPMFHTDQGSLYLSGAFQRRLKDMGFRQSMSKRGNCWDNAPQESFFGHFKDEVDYSSCRSIEELDELVYEYMQYYNKERCQWTRNRMTPVEYERYLDSMDEVAFAAYLKKETEKYNRMKARAAEKKKEHIKTLGV